MNESILIVDDNADDAALIKRAVLSLHPKSTVRLLTSAKELKEWVEGEGRFADREEFPYPCLILLDLRMPEINGLELLEWLKDHPRHSAIPVIAVSSYDRQREIRKSYQLGARTFLSKPVSAEELRTAILVLDAGGRFWRSVGRTRIPHRKIQRKKPHPSSEWFSSRYYVHQNHDDCDNQQHMDQAANSGACDEAKKPQNDEYQADCPEHKSFGLSG